MVNNKKKLHIRKAVLAVPLLLALVVYLGGSYEKSSNKSVATENEIRTQLIQLAVAGDALAGISDSSPVSASRNGSLASYITTRSSELSKKIGESNLDEAKKTEILDDVESLRSLASALSTQLQTFGKYIEYSPRDDLLDPNKQLLPNGATADRARVAATALETLSNEYEFSTAEIQDARSCLQGITPESDSQAVLTCASAYEKIRPYVYENMRTLANTGNLTNASASIRQSL